MEIQYIRKLTASHMVVEQAAELREWEEQMVNHVTVDGILFAKCVRDNNQNYLWYDISGKQSLDIILESGELCYELLGRILAGIYAAMEQLEDILLQADALLLCPECIFLDYRTGQIYFCYYPGNEKRMPEAFTELMEYLLTRIDHGDERVVTLAYDVYGQLSEGKGEIGELKELLRLPYEQEDVGDTMEPDLEVCSEEPEKSVGNKCSGGKIKEGCEKEGDSSSCEEQNAMEKRRVFGSKCANRLRQILQTRDWRWGKIIFGKERILRRKTKPDKRRKEEEEKFVFEPEEEEDCRETRPTVLLTQIARPPEGILR